MEKRPIKEPYEYGKETYKRETASSVSTNASGVGLFVAHNLPQYGKQT